MENNSSALDEALFRREIEEYYLPQQLVTAILELGEIPKGSVETLIAVAFLDIADYTFISKFLSPNENQVVLNGLFTALNHALNRHGGYLNKIEGDSMMFHYGGLTDPHIKDMSPDECRAHIARELFNSCIEMQRICTLFNDGKDTFGGDVVDTETMEAVEQAKNLIGELRQNTQLGQAFNASFQIRVRIGASIGEVTIGNIGPKGAKQWDIIGLPVITAKRMESTAPIGGLRISEDLYKILDETGVVASFYQRFKREATIHSSVYRDITLEELFKPGKVLLKDKKNIEFVTYSVQVSAGLPEALSQQVAGLMKRGEDGAERILNLLQYYRGNKSVINTLEELFVKLTVDLRKDLLLKILLPAKHKGLKKKIGNVAKLRRYVDKHYSLFRLFALLGKLQDGIKYAIQFDPPPSDFIGYDNYMSQEEESVRRRYRLIDKSVRENTYFYNVVFPLFFRSIKTSILEYQTGQARNRSPEAEPFEESQSLPTLEGPPLSGIQLEALAEESSQIASE